MEIKKGSWHYKFYQAGHGGQPPLRTNLCSYFWRTVFGLGLATICIGTALIFLTIVGVLFYEHTAGSFMAVGGVGAVILLLFLRSRILAREPGLLRLYLRAKKEKVCPLVDIVK